MNPARHAGWYAANVAISNISANSRGCCVKLILLTKDGAGVCGNESASLEHCPAIGSILGLHGMGRQE
jgi:hypothetical protein